MFNLLKVSRHNGFGLRNLKRRQAG